MTSSTQSPSPATRFSPTGEAVYVSEKPATGMHATDQAVRGAVALAVPMRVVTGAGSFDCRT